MLSNDDHTITFIEAIRTKDPQIDILNLETCISIVATYFCGVLLESKCSWRINYKQISINRYVDWAITTPLCF